MIYDIDKTKKEASYLQLYKILRNNIINNTYKFGEKMPSKRTVSEETGLSVITIEHSYAILEDEGYIKAKERKGYFVIYKKSDFYSSYESKNEHIIKHKTLSDEFFSISIYKKAVRNVLSKYDEEIFIKSPSTGCDELKNALSSYLMRSRGMNVSKNQIIIGAGAQYLYGLMIQILGRNKKYAIESPSYKKIEETYKTGNIDYEKLKLGKNGILTGELNKTKANVLHVTPYNSYPTLVTANASKRHEYLEFAKNNNAIIIEDDYNSEFSSVSKTEATLFSTDENERVIYINSFSKTIAPSIRIGYMILPKNKTLDYLEKITHYSCTVSVLDQLVLTEIIENGSFERHINSVRRKLRREKKN